MSSAPVTALAQQVQAGIQAAASALREAAAQGDLDTAQWGELLAVAFSARNQLDHALTCAVGAFDRRAEQSHDLADTVGLAPATWLSHNLGIGPSAAHAQVRVARRLGSLPATAKAFERGQLSAQHVSVVSRAVESVERGGGDAGLAEALMLEEAGRRNPHALHRWGLGLLHRLAPREMEAEEERRHRNRSLHLRELFDGGYALEGYLDPIGGATVKTAIEAVLGPRARGDERSPGQRRADAVVELATMALDGGRLPVRGGQRPHLLVTASLETLRADPGAPAALLDWGFRAPRGADRPGGDETAPPLACRSRSMKHGAARTWRRRRGWQAALRTTGQSGTARRAGSGKTRREGVREEPAL